MNGDDLPANPYVGLRPFFADDSLYFFGREQQTAELLEILRQHRFLGVVGSSGSGKSSLVRAGLLPALLGGFLVQDRDRWCTVQIKPGDAPIGNLAVGLLEAMGEATTPESVAKLEQDIRDGHTDSVVKFLSTRLESNANLLLLVDQFEEIFAFRGIAEEGNQKSLDPARRKERARRTAEAADFVDLLLALAEQRDLPIYVALTMRSDFLGDCDLFYGLPETLNRGRYLVPRMTRDQLRDAVECPAVLLGAHIAPRLLDDLLNELGDRFDRLPLLQHALLRTWDEWQRAEGVGPIDLPHFKSAGGLERALDQDAENALKGLDIGVTERVFKRLTDTDASQRRVRSPARLSELAAAAGAERGAVEGIVRRFEENGRSFVHSSADGQPDDPRVDISHESLIRQWDRLRDWVDEERRSRDEYCELVKKARKRERGQAALLQDPELQMVVDWRAKASPSRGWAQRYSVADGDFDSAVGYLDESLAARFRNLAELELRRRWEKIWSPLIVATEVVVGILFARFNENWKDLLITIIDVKAKEFSLGGKTGLGLPVNFFSSLFNKRASYELLLFLGGCVGLNLYARRLHRRLAFPRILRAVVSSGGRSAIEVKAGRPEPQDAVDVHHTVYAPTYRRVAGFVIDFFVFFFLLVVVQVVATIGAGASGYSENAYTWTWIGAVVVFSWLYSTLEITSKRQGTLGMRAVGILMTDLHGEGLSFAQASAWYGYRVLSYLFFGLGFFSQPFTRKRQTFHDWRARTVVLRRPSQIPCPKCGELATRGGFKKWQIIVAIVFSLAGGLVALAADRKPTKCPKCAHTW
jgi:uncharacterized RDD family membrane protein YckC/energy-coupling factor transporter ATP-binding protein EcfA2